MTPTQIAVSVVLIASVGFGTGWVANGWRLHAEIAEQKAGRAEEKAKLTAEALQDLTSATRKINEAASGAQTELKQAAQKLSIINQRFKDEKPKPLPVDCAPDPVRVRYLRDATETYNQAIIGPQLSR